MKLATSTSHDPECSGCPCCREEFARMLEETPVQAARRLTAQSRAALRSAETRPTFRVSQQDTDSAWRDHFARACDVPPDPYAPELERRREAAGIVALTADLDPRYRPLGKPPDGYALAIAARRLQAEVRAAATPAAEPREEMKFTADGVPDGFATAIARRAAR